MARHGCDSPASNAIQLHSTCLHFGPLDDFQISCMLYDCKIITLMILICPKKGQSSCKKNFRKGAEKNMGGEKVPASNLS